MQAMFERLDADVYLMVDGDCTYPAAAASRLIAPILSGDADMVVGSRLHSDSKSQFRRVNRFGNGFFAVLVRIFFGASLTDILSGYRAFSRRFVESVPVFGGGFEIEAELTIKSLERGLRILEVPVDLAMRPAGSSSKIRVFRDGFVILSTILALLRDYKPMTAFGALGALLLVGTLILLSQMPVTYGNDASMVVTALTFIAGIRDYSGGSDSSLHFKTFSGAELQLKRSPTRA